MKVCVDVYYTDDFAVASGALFSNWHDAEAVDDIFHVVREIAPYEPGQFYKRELPPVLGLLDRVEHELEVIVIDGFVWLDDATTRGLGAHLFDALDGRVPVIGVAKNRFRESAVATEVIRGESQRPLFVTSVGMDQLDAAECIRSMHGEFRLPTLLKRADRTGRDEADRLLNEGTENAGHTND